MAVEFNPFLPAFIADPYPFYHRLRAEDPVYRAPLGFWVLSRHIAFGWGIHFCLGAPLARLEGQLAIGTALRRLPRLTLATSAPEWRESSTLRGLRRLPVEFE